MAYEYEGNMVDEFYADSDCRNIETEDLNELSNLNLHESLRINDTLTVVRVISGFIYHTIHEHDTLHITSVFVPEMNSI